MIFAGLTICGGIGSWAGAALDHNNYLGAASIGLGAVGSLVGVWVGYKAGEYYAD